MAGCAVSAARPQQKMLLTVATVPSPFNPTQVSSPRVPPSQEGAVSTKNWLGQASQCCPFPKGPSV